MPTLLPGAATTPACGSCETTVPAGTVVALRLADHDREAGVGQLRLGAGLRAADDARHRHRRRRRRRGAGDVEVHCRALLDLTARARRLRDDRALRVLVALHAGDPAGDEAGVRQGRGRLLLRHPDHVRHRDVAAAVEGAERPGDRERGERGDDDEQDPEPGPARAALHHGLLHLGGAQHALDVLLELRGRAARAGVLVERAHDDLRQRRRHLGIEQLRRPDDTVQLLLRDDAGVGALERVAAGEQQVGHEAEPVDVRGRRRRPPGDFLGAQIARHLGRDARTQVRRRVRLRQTGAGELDGAVRGAYRPSWDRRRRGRRRARGARRARRRRRPPRAPRPALAAARGRRASRRRYLPDPPRRRSSPDPRGRRRRRRRGRGGAPTSPRPWCARRRRGPGGRTTVTTTGRPCASRPAYAAAARPAGRRLFVL